MTTARHEYACPRCGDPLSPIYVLEDRRRRMIGLACREPYCDHFQRVPDPRPDARGARRARALRGLADDDAQDKRSA